MNHNDVNDLLDHGPFSRSSPSESDTIVGDEEHVVGQSTKDNIGLPVPSATKNQKVVRNDESSSGDGDEDENDGVEITFAEAPMIGDDDKEDEDENDGGKKTFIEAPMVEDDNDNDDDEGMEEPGEADVEEQATEKQETTVDHAKRQKVLQEIAHLEELIVKTKETKKFSKALAVARKKDFRMLTVLKERIDIAMVPLKKFKDENFFVRARN